MSNQIAQPRTIREGTIFLEMMLPWPWPVPERFLVHELTLPDGVIRLFGEPDGRLSVNVNNETGRTLIECVTCVLDLPERRVVAFAMAWSIPSDWSAFLNGGHIGSTNPDDTIPERWSVHPRKADALSPTDFSGQNSLAIKARRDRLAGWQGIPNRVAAGPGYVLAALQGEIKQIHDLLILIDRGGTHHIAGLAARLRAVIATGRPLPLLQLHAAALNAPLIVFTEPHPKSDTFKGAQSSASFSIWSAPEGSDRNSIDLDVWLELPWGQIGDNLVTHRQALKNIADTIGAHVDPDLHQVFVTLNASRSGMHGVDQQMLSIYLTRVARTVLNIAKELTRAT